MYQDLLQKKKSISVTGLGYVGLPLALEFAKHFKVIGFDINEARIKMMQEGIDPSKELDPKAFEGCDIQFTSNAEDLRLAHFHIIGVPTDIDEHKVPDLTPLMKASESIGAALKPGDFVIYESTVYPGCTEEDCVPVLEKFSKVEKGILQGEESDAAKYEKLVAGKDFKFGYSPERIVPGEKVRTLTKILKIVSGNDAEALEEISKVYAHIIEAGVYKAESIKVAEAAKVIENTQRDINISLMNELSIIFDKIGIDTNAVIEAAGTKWNFHKYRPGLVGGHCISVDPFYLLHKAVQLGHDPQVIAAGRRVNDYIPHFIAKRCVQKLVEKGKNPGNARVLLLGVTFKENVADIRNSKVFDLIKELREYSLTVDVIDPFASSNQLKDYSVDLLEAPAGKYDAIIVAVGHKAYRELNLDYFKSISNGKVLLIDVKNIYKEFDKKDIIYWSL